MKASQEEWIKRWDNEWKAQGQAITNAFQNKKSISKLNLSNTDDGLVDLRGYSAPKVRYRHLSNKGNESFYVGEGIRIKKQKFENIDFSLADFEMCEFYDCQFIRCKLDHNNFKEVKFRGCSFEDIHFRNSFFNAASFAPSGILFIEKKTNLNNCRFESCNLNRASFYTQGFHNVVIQRGSISGVSLSDCRLDHLNFIGNVKNLYIKSCKANEVDLREAVLTGILFIKQKLDGFLLPEGDVYYRFYNKQEELSKVDISGFSPEELIIVDIIKKVLLDYGASEVFVDINWLNKEEIETGKRLIKLLKESGAGSR